MRKTYYITTPIYYPNAEPHLGHVYTTVAADVAARYYRLCGADTFFLTGTDEHGTKMVKTAAAAGVEPMALATQFADAFRNLWGELHISNDDFIRTTEPRHKEGVAEIVRRLDANGDLYLGHYEGWYDEGQEEFVTETDAKAHDYKSAITGRPLLRYKEPTYFFRLSKYVPRVLAHIEANGHFIRPEGRRNEVLSKLRAGVDDLSISRATLKWGIPLPNDPQHVLYVWIDALSNYITALGYGSGDTSRFDRYWPADAHLIGKDILWFHTVYWPAMLFSLGVEPPRMVVAHGWFMSDGKKMGKTLGNFIDLAKLREKISRYGIDALRYFLATAAPFGDDPDWSDAGFDKAYNELVNVLGNLLNRTLKMINNYRQGVVPAVNAKEPIDDSLIERMAALPGQLASAYANFELKTCAQLPIELARAANGYIDATAPFKLAKDPAAAARLDTILNLSAQAIATALAALGPILIERAPLGLRQLGLESDDGPLAETLAQPLAPGTKVGEGQPLYPRMP